MAQQKGSQFPPKTGKISETDLRPLFYQRKYPLGIAGYRAARREAGITC
jgi:hypothetical protein